MADEPETGALGISDPAAAGAGDDENAALVAEIEAELGVKPAKPAKKPVEKPADPADDEDDTTEDEPDDESAADADDEDAAADEDEPDDEEDDEDSDEEDPDDDVDAEKDPALKKRLDAARRTEQRQRQRLEQDRASFDRERTAWQSETKQHREAVARINAMAARAKIDPAGLLEALGVDDMEYAGQQAYARGKAASGKPEYRAAAERAIRERELADQAAANAKRIADLEAKLEAKDTQTAAERELDTYFDKAFRKATDATPITARLIAKRPATARAELAITASRLAEKLGRLPKATELLAAHEKREVRALRQRGITPPTPGAGKPALAPGKGATAKPAAKPAAKPPIAKPSDDEDAIPSNADLLRELAQRN